MREVLISIQPKWVEKICRKEKTVEVRKARPKCEVPFKCYIYETQGRTETPWVDEEGHHIFKGRGQVVAEFVCDKVVKFPHDPYDPAFSETADLSCVGIDGLSEYLGHKDYGYGWHITDLVVYDKPRELSEFETCNCSYVMNEDGYPIPSHHIKTPPQSWFYIKAKEPRQTAD
jgi:predicted transcriptional regulator